LDAANSQVPIGEYEVAAFDEGVFWHVAFELKGEVIAGGGPDYLINKETGKIVEKRYYQ